MTNKDSTIVKMLDVEKDYDSIIISKMFGEVQKSVDVPVDC